MPEDRILIILYQYYMNKGDKLKFEARLISDKIRRQKVISAIDFYEYQRALLRSELFEELYDEFHKLSQYLNY